MAKDEQHAVTIILALIPENGLRPHHSWLMREVTLTVLMNIPFQSGALIEDVGVQVEATVVAGERLPREQCNHYHCSFLEVDEKLLADLRSCGPYQRFEQSEKKAAVEESKEKSDAAKKKKEDYEVMLRKETLLMRRRFQEKKALEKEQEKKAAEKEEKRKAIGTEKNKVADGKEKKKAGKRRRIKRVAIEK